MLAFLIRNARKNIKYSELVSEVWRGREQGVTLNAVSQVAYRLRDKMKTIKIPMTIKISLKNNCEIIHSKRIMVFIKGGGVLQCRVFFI